MTTFTQEACRVLPGTMTSTKIFVRSPVALAIWAQLQIQRVVGPQAL